MAKTTFTAEQLEAALLALKTADEDYPNYPLRTQIGHHEGALWNDYIYPITLTQVGEDKNVRVDCAAYFGGEEGGDHRMYCVLKTGYGEDARHFEKTGEYNSWDDSYWDGGFYEVVSQEVKKIEWVPKK